MKKIDTQYLLGAQHLIGMINHKYQSLFILCFVGMLLSAAAPKFMQQYYPTEFCCNQKVKYYCFAKHTWLGK
jgi:hypothetical protein